MRVDMRVMDDWSHAHEIATSGTLLYPVDSLTTNVTNPVHDEGYRCLEILKTLPTGHKNVMETQKIVVERVDNAFERGETLEANEYVVASITWVENVRISYRF